MSYKILFSLVIILLIASFLPLEAEAVEAFTISPAKTEISLSAGQEVIKYLTVINQTGHQLYFKISKEDFEGSPDPKKATIFLGEKKGRFSLKDWLEIGVEEFTLGHSERVSIPIKINVPLDAAPGGYYAAVFTASQPSLEEQGQGKIISRAGSLFFVKIKGDTKEEGLLKEFTADKRYYQDGPIEFELVSENTGDVYLVPYGIIEIRNLFGRKISEARLDPWFVLPDSLRTRNISYDKELLFGLYTATAKINRGYQNIIDEQRVRFLVAPWKIVSAGAIGLALVLVIIICAIIKKQF